MKPRGTPSKPPSRHCAMALASSWRFTSRPVQPTVLSTPISPVRSTRLEGMDLLMSSATAPTSSQEAMTAKLPDTADTPPMSSRNEFELPPTAPACSARWPIPDGGQGDDLPRRDR